MLGAYVNDCYGHYYVNRVPYCSNMRYSAFSRAPVYPIHYDTREITRLPNGYNPSLGLPIPQNDKAVLSKPYPSGEGFSEKLGNPSGRNEHQFRRNEVIIANSRRYVVSKYSGRGTFGQVVVVWDQQSQQHRALKMLKRDYFYSQQGMIEISLLRLINQTVGDHVVKLIDNFEHDGHICILFELLELNLYDFMQDNSIQPYYFLGIRAITYQLLKVLVKLKEIGVVHADLKPENVMIVNHNKWPFYVKVIDFGSAFKNSNKKYPTYIQSRYYRAPEVILAADFSFGIDMWSLGCIMAEMVTGWAIFPGYSQYEQIRYIVRACGPLSEGMISSGKNSSIFFKKKNIWKLMDKNEYSTKSGTTVKPMSRYSMKSFSTVSAKLLKNINYFESMGNVEIFKKDVEQFIFALKQFLIPDPLKRPPPEQVIKSSFWNFVDYIPIDSKWFFHSSWVMYSSRAWNCSNQAHPSFYNPGPGHVNAMPTRPCEWTSVDPHRYNQNVRRQFVCRRYNP